MSPREPLLLALLEVDVVCATLCQFLEYNDHMALSSVSPRLVTTSLTRAHFFLRACFVVSTFTGGADMARFLSRIHSDMLPFVKRVRLDSTLRFRPPRPAASDDSSGGNASGGALLLAFPERSAWEIFQHVEVLDFTRDVTAKTQSISRLTKLTSLNLSTHLDPELVPLAQLTTLKHLFLNESNVTNASLAHIKSLTSLETLEIRNCAFITDLSCLAGLVHLRRLVMGGNEVNDLSVLSELPKLRHFHYVSATRKSWPKMDFPLRAPDLEFCSVAQTPVRNADFLLFSPRLRHLNISWTTLSSAPPLGHLTQLRVLIVSSPLPRDMEYYAPLETLSDLERIEFHKIGQASLEPPVIEAKFPERVRQLLVYP
ncbi:hypothetical protein Gpo141_00008724 [Globisporangium polare]